MKRELMAGLIAVLVIASVMMFSGCVEEEEKKMSAPDIKAMVLANAEETNSYKFDMNTTMKMTMSNETGEIELTMLSNGRGVVDLVDKKMNLNMNSSIEMPETTEVPGPMEMEMYLVNNTMYMKMDLGIPELPAQWTKIEMPEAYEESWTSQNQLEQQMALLNISEVELLDDEELNGVDCYVLKIVPEMGKFWNSTMAAVMDKSTRSLAPGMDIQKMMKRMSTKEWIAKDTKFPMKTQMAMNIVMSSEDLAIPETEEKFTITADEEVETRFYDYNKPVSIELPEAAEAAVAWPPTPTQNQSALNQTTLNQTATTAG
jgi:hypothetical protein